MSLCILIETDHYHRLWRARLDVQYAQPVSSSSVAHKVCFSQSIVVAFVFPHRVILTPQLSAIELHTKHLVCYDAPSTRIKPRLPPPFYQQLTFVLAGQASL